MTASTEGETVRPFPWRLGEPWLAPASLLALTLLGLFVLLKFSARYQWQADTEIITSWGVLTLEAALVWLVLLRGRGVKPRDIGLTGFGWRGLALVAASLIVLSVTVLALIWSLEATGLARPSWAPSQFSPTELVESIAVAPLMEELLFRGFLFTGFRRYYGRRRAAVLTGAMFALVHLDWKYMVLDFVMGLVLAALYDQTGSIFPSMLAHSLWNASADLHLVPTLYVLFVFLPVITIAVAIVLLPWLLLRASRRRCT
jgi:membrane protease YdiL (CAAX protease family)